VLFRVIFGGGFGATVLVDLLSVSLPDWAAGITLLGPVTSESLLSGLYDGMRLAAIIICIGAANSLANPRRLLASLPPALYEIGTAVVIALSLFPQLAESIQRVRRARRLRGDPGRGVGALRRIVVPVLEDALERSLSLAASMDARGYGRAGQLGAGARRVTGTMLVGGLLGLCVGSYAFLDSTAPRLLAWPMLVAGLLLAAAGFVAAGRRVTRTRYRPDRWHVADVVIAATGIAVAVLMSVVASNRPDVAVPDPAFAPPLSLPALCAVLLAVVPALVAPSPAAQHASAGERPQRAEARTT
jgi:energy-coupling factor transport system permease protein